MVSICEVESKLIGEKGFLNFSLIQNSRTKVSSFILNPDRNDGGCIVFFSTSV